MALRNRADKIYFDSFGVRPLKEVEELVGKGLIYNKNRIQAFSSNKCGYFCIDFINNVKDADSFHEWLLGYDVRDYEIND